ncbi:hypothetical protein MUO14_23940 [Halobacillus shinanisalinarum]|uniref:Uncharacterized protein n=1 Tax=Halobacillus shinanisalinarum TaxID=2932258 RepID=A0ABY4GZ91_9BACI|nr:hypothetical protein [Halobacillus shinanisalinarum]UOQ93384.1 hypothetical protein MUO14_23940 [Halobacillus shinanisalinarum]
MTFGEMKEFTRRLKDIMSMQDGLGKDNRLALLMTDLEVMYQIPMYGINKRNEFIKKHPHVMQLYKTVSLERNL